MIYKYKEIKTWPYDEKEGCFTKGDIKIWITKWCVDRASVGACSQTQRAGKARSHD
jgi:hypothetical protein